MWKRIGIGVGVLFGAAALGGTVLRAPLAAADNAMQSVIVKNTTANPVPVREVNTDTNGNIKVHEQGTANVNVTNSSLSVTATAPAPITGGGGQATINGDGVTHNLGSTVTASALSLYLPNTVFTLFLYDQGNQVAVFQGPGYGYLDDVANVGQAPVFTNSVMNIPLSRPLTFDSAKCAGGGTHDCVVGWVGNSQ